MAVIGRLLVRVWVELIPVCLCIERVRRDFDNPFRYRVVVGQAFLCAILYTPVKVLLNKMGARNDCCGGLCTSKCMWRKLLEEDMRATTNIANTGKTVKVEV